MTQWPVHIHIRSENFSLTYGAIVNISATVLCEDIRNVPTDLNNIMNHTQRVGPNQLHLSVDVLHYIMQ